MKTKVKLKIMAVGLALIIITMVAVILLSNRSKFTNVKLNGYLGGEKTGFFDDEKVKEVFKEYGIDMSYVKMGSLDMARADVSSMDYLFPSNSFAAGLYQSNGGESQMANDAFISPLVIYSWDIAVEALMDKGVVSLKDGVYTVDMEKLIKLTLNGTTWEDLGVNELYGPICVNTTDPVHSNSGNLMTVLAATILNGNKVIQKDDIPDIINPIHEFLSMSGYKDTSSADLFSQYLRTGVGGKTLVALYENQMIEFARQNAKDWESIKDRVRVLYPSPTVWSNHQYIAINEDATRFFEAMNDEKSQQLAWEGHGFRVGAMGASQLNDEMRAMGIAEDVTRTIPMPDYSSMEALLNALSAAEQ